jgi:hypothetical protein
LTFTRIAALLITVGIAAASFVLSFAALHDLAVRAGIPANLAWLWPLVIDGTILQATMAVVALARHRDQERSRRYFWIVLWSSAAVSLAANALHAVVPASRPLSPWITAAIAVAAIAVVAPVGLLAATHGLTLLIRVSGSVEVLRREHDTTDVAGSGEVAPSVTEVHEVAHPVPRPSPVAVAALQPWEAVAEVIASRAATGDVVVTDVASVLHLSYETEMSPPAIGRQLGIDQRVVDEIVSASAELLRSGDVSVERVAV